MPVARDTRRRAIPTASRSGSGVLEARSRISWLFPFHKDAPFGRRGLVRFLVFGDWCERLSLVVASFRGDETSAALHEAEDAHVLAVQFGHGSDADELHGLTRVHMPVERSGLEPVEVMPVEGRHHQSSSSSPAGQSRSRGIPVRARAPLYQPSNVT